MSLDSIESAQSSAGLATERIYSAKRHIQDVCARRIPRRTAGRRPRSGAPENVDDFSGWQLSSVACPAGLMTILGLTDDRMLNAAMFFQQETRHMQEKHHVILSAEAEDAVKTFFSPALSSLKGHAD
jgi:hypothetical protein